MEIVSPLRVGLFPFQMAFLWLINRGDPNYLLSGVILQVGNLPGTYLQSCLRQIQVPPKR